MTLFFLDLLVRQQKPKRLKSGKRRINISFVKQKQPRHCFLVCLFDKNRTKQEKRKEEERRGKKRKEESDKQTSQFAVAQQEI